MSSDLSLSPTDGIEVAKIGNVSELLNAMHVVCDSLERTPLWWRGHGVSTWQLLASVHRHEESATRGQYEHGITTRFMERARPRYHDPPALNDLPGWLALMQHYGLPTRLMDWSESPLIGLYFAVCDRKHDDEDGVIWVLDPSTLNQELHDALGTLDFNNKEVVPLLREINIPFPDPEPERVVALTSSHVDQRMMIQQSSFTIHGSSADISKHQLQKRFLRSILVDGAQKPAIRGELRLLGFTRAYLFPDLENLAKFEREQRFPAPIGSRPKPQPMIFASDAWGTTLEAKTKEELERKAREWVREQTVAGRDVNRGWDAGRAKRSKGGWSIDLLVNC